MQNSEIASPSGLNIEDDTQNPTFETDLASDQPIGPAPWARLVAVERFYPNIQISEDERIIGRIDAEDNKKISKSHCRIHKDSSGQIFIRNLSGNGTQVNGVLLGKDEFTVIWQGDEVVLGPNASGCPVYILQILNEEAQEVLNDRKRSCECFDTNAFYTQLETRTRLKVDCPMNGEPVDGRIWVEARM